MSTQTVEIKSEEQNISLEEQAQQQEKLQVNSVDNTSVEVKSNDTTSKSTDPTRPEWLPEKFSSAEDLAKAYGELEKKLSKPEAVEEVKGNTNETTTNTLEPYYQEFAEKGELSEKSYKSLEKLGLNKDLVDGYIAGQKAIADNEVKMVHDTVGGKDNYEKVIQYAQNNLTKAEQDAFNLTLDTGSIEQVRFAVQAIASRAGISGSTSQMIEGDTETTAIDAFQSIAQLTEAMNNPKYDRDPAYRREVERKIAKSSVL